MVNKIKKIMTPFGEYPCGKCLTGVKTRFEDTYQYGDTWKSKKR